MKQGILGEGYYAPGEKDDKGKNIKTPVDFNFSYIQWGITSQEGDKIRIDRPAPILLGLRIYDHERVDRSQWGPIDGEPEDEETAITKPFRFGSDDEKDDTPGDEDEYIPPNDEAELTEEQTAELARLFPSTTSIKPKVLPLDAFPSLANQMSSIMSTTTHVPTSILARTVGAGVSGGAAVPMGSAASTLIGRTLGREPSGLSVRAPHVPGGNAREIPPGAPPPSGGGGGGPPGGGGNPGAAGGGGNPPLTDKLVGKEPGSFDGSRDKVEDFLTEWGVYQGLNRRSYAMDTSFDWTMLFLSYIRGPQVIQWVRAQINKAANYVRQNGPQSVYHAGIWNDMIQEFATNFQDIMSKERARAELKQLKMKGGDIDGYNSRFKQLVQNGEYGLNDERTMEQYVEGLPIGLQEAIITNEQTDFLFTWQHWMEAAVRQQKIWLKKQGLRNLFQNKGQGKHPT